MHPFATNRSQFIIIACLLSGCASPAPEHVPVGAIESIQIQGFASDGVTPDPAKSLTVHPKDLEAMMAESWPTDNYPILTRSRLSGAIRKNAFTQMTFFGRYFQKCEPPFKMLEIDSQPSTNDSLNEIWTAQMCGIMKWNVSVTDDRLSVTLIK